MHVEVLIRLLDSGFTVLGFQQGRFTSVYSDHDDQSDLCRILALNLEPFNAEPE